MTIKTIHLTNNWHAESGGVATFYRQMLEAAERRGRSMRLVVPAAADRVEEHGRFGRIYHVAGKPAPLSPGYWMMMPGQYLWPRSPLRRILAEERADLVECCDKYTLNYLAALLRRGWLLGRDYRPAVVGLSCERMDRNMALYLSGSPAALAFCRHYMKWLHFPMFDHHIAVSPLAAEELRIAARGHAVRRGVWVRPMGADCGLFHPERRTAAMRAWLERLAGAPEGSLLLLYAGRLAPEKNLQLLLDTMMQLEADSAGKFHLVVAGDGPARADFERQCDRLLPGAVRMLGHVRDREMLADLYANSDVFVHPNACEPFGIAPLEAMASGLALVAPDEGGVTSYANRANAWLTRPDATSFAGAVRAIAADPQATSRRSAAARATAEEFDWERVTDRFFDLYDQLHALVLDGASQPALAPEFYSTPGDRWGYET
jgi:glycosyltransferase involved in cell wall biosynthesis